MGRVCLASDQLGSKLIHSSRQPGVGLINLHMKPYSAVFGASSRFKTRHSDVYGAASNGLEQDVLLPLHDAILYKPALRLQ